MARFRNISDYTLTLPDVGDVDPDALVDVPGDVVDTDQAPVDAYLVRGSGGDRAWPKALWSDESSVAAPSRDEEV